MRWESLISRIYRSLPPSLAGAYREGKRRLVSAARKRKVQEMIRAHGSFVSADLRGILADLGVEAGRDLMVQAAFAGLATYRGRADEIMELLLELVGGRGTLCMPAYPKKFGRGVEIFDVRKTPSDAGILSELFRRHGSSVRSLQPTHTVCAAGPRAGYFTDEHHLSPYPCGDRSAWTRIASGGGLLVGLGLPAGWTTCWHAVEDHLRGKYPVAVYRPGTRIFRVRDYRGEVLEVPAYVHKPQRRVAYGRFLEELPPGAFRARSFHGCSVFVLEAEPFLRTMIGIAESGRTIYD